MKKFFGKVLATTACMIMLVGASDIRFQYRGNNADLAAKVDAISNAL